MSNITLFQNGNNLPAHLRKGELSDLTRSLMGGGQTKRISIEGGVFRMMMGGKEVAVNEDRAMNIIIVRAAESNSRTFYEGTYQKGMKAQPTCWSDNSQTPHKDVKSPQSASCATCPQNVKGSGQGDSRACRFQRRLAVVLENDIEGDIYAMSIPAASLFSNGEGRKMGLQQYARFLGGHGVEVNAVVTEMRFDTNSTAPKLTFSAARPLEETEYAAVVNRRNEPAALDAVTMTVAYIDDKGAEAAPTAPIPTAPVAPPAPKKGGFKVTKSAEAAEVEEPTKRETGKATVPNVDNILSAWGDTDD